LASKILEKTVKVIAISISIYHLYTAVFGIHELFLHRSLHIVFAFTLLFLLYPASKTPLVKGKANFFLFNALFVILSIIAFGYITYSYRLIPSRMILTQPLSALEMLLGVLAILLVLEAARRTVGLSLVIVAAVFLLYSYIPLGHRGWSPTQIIDYMYFSQEGIFGIPIGVTSTYVFLFIIFGAFLKRSGATQFFIDLATSLAGRASGGPAKACVVANALLGTLSGSAVGDTYITGSITIPLMKKLRYDPTFAGAVAATAATGAQIMPPVLGAAAFVMSELIGIPYARICIAAALPAILYFLAVGLMVHFEGKRKGLKGLPKEEMPELRRVLGYAYLFTPILVIIYMLLSGYSLSLTSFIAIIFTIFISLLRKATRITVKGLLNALEEGAKDVLMISSAAACAGLIIGAISLSGAGIMFTSYITSYFQGQILLALFLIMVAAIILGMGMPTTPAYIMVSALGAPALVSLGLPLLSAHMFIFYFACISMITPPVAMAAYAGAQIAGAGMMRTGVVATKLALTSFIVPYMFVLEPALLMRGPVELIIWRAGISAIGIVAFTAGVQGWLLSKAGVLQRIILVVAGFVLLYPRFEADLVGLGLMGIILVTQKISQRDANRMGQSYTGAIKPWNRKVAFR